MAFHEDILEKLLRLADRPGSPGEGAAALHRAEVIAKARGINLDDVRRSMNFSSQSSARSSRWGGFGSGYTEPSDNSQDFFDQMTMFANQRQYAYQGADHRGFNPSDGAKFHKWTYRHNYNFYVLMSHTERVKSGYEFVSQKVKNPKWMFCHIHKIQPISIGSDVDFLISFVQSFNYKKADDDANQEKLERERPQHVVATPSQAKLEKILLKYKYTLEPPQRPQQDNRTWDSADGASFISFGIDGDWSAFVRVGERLQSELKRAGKDRTPEELEAFLKKKATETTKLHPEPDLDHILQFVQKNGFTEEGTGTPKSAIRVFKHSGVKIIVEVGRADPSAAGRISKTEQISWSIKPIAKSYEAGYFMRRTGFGFATFEKEMRALVETGQIGDFEIGLASITKLLQEYRFKAYDAAGIDVKFRLANYTWYNIGDKTLASGTKFSYFLGFHLVTGHYVVIRRNHRVEANMADSKEMEGMDVNILRQKLHKLGFEPGQVHLEDIQQTLRQMESICRQFGYSDSDWSGTFAFEFQSNDRLTTIRIYQSTASFVVEHRDNPITILGSGTDPMELYTILKKHSETVKPKSVAERVMDVAKKYGFKIISDEDDDKMLTHADKLTLYVSRLLGGWDLYFHSYKMVGGITPEALKEFLEGIYGRQD